MDTIKPNNIDEYIANFPEATQALLQQLRATIKEAAPEAEEAISYGMPAFRQNRILVYFAAYSKHIGFYPTGSGIKAFEEEIAKYKWSKGAVQFPIDKPLPIELITKMVSYRVIENMKKGKR